MQRYVILQNTDVDPSPMSANIDLGTFLISDGDPIPEVQVQIKGLIL